jgi:hypothetical protein
MWNYPTYGSKSGIDPFGHPFEHKDMVLQSHQMALRQSHVSVALGFHSGMPSIWGEMKDNSQAKQMLS